MIFGRRKLDDIEQRLNALTADSWAGWLGVDGGMNYSGANVDESSALSIPAVWRAVNLISTTIAQLPLDAYRYEGDDIRRKVRSWISQPGLPVYTRFEFVEMMLAHLLLHGNHFSLKIRNRAGAVTQLFPVHPSKVTVILDLDTFKKSFEVTRSDGVVKLLTEDDVFHIPGFSMDGIRGLSVISVARNSLGTSLAGERAAAKNFANGSLLSGIVTPVDEDLTEAEATAIKKNLDTKTAGWEHAGEIAVINRKLKFDPWSQTQADAEFIKSREFQIDEVARWFGLPPYELMKVDKQTSFGTGVEAQQRGVARQVLAPWTNRIEERLALIVPNGVHPKFNFKALERPTPVEEVNLLATQIQAGMLTVNEARTIQNREPLPGGDQLTLPGMQQEKANTDEPI